ncbi:hypothetical protein T09_15459 [Trichinella sp. T9]|nr:hypothetical protein T09_15459 [Trichinella sp. T9]
MVVNDGSSGNVRLFVFHWWLTCWLVHSYKVNNATKMSDKNVGRWKMAPMPSDVDALFNVTSWKSPLVRIPLVVDQSVCAFFKRADACYD